MARPLRVELPGGLYLVSARSLSRQRLFRDEGELGDFLSRLPQLAEGFGVVFHGFCLLPNHYHLLVETPRPNLSRALHRLNAGYTATVNARRHRRGPLLQSRYRSLLLGEEWLLPLSVHVHLNPIRKRLTADPWTYEGSSARAYAPGGPGLPGLTTDRVLRLAGGRRAYEVRLQEALAKPPPAPWKQVWRQVVLGGGELRARVLEGLEGRDVREIPGFTGRPEGPSLEQVVALVSEHTGLPPGQLTSGKFQRVLARKVAIHLARKFTACTLREIGDAFGVDYTTVHMAARRLESLRAEDPSVDRFVTGLEEVLRDEGAGEPAPPGSEAEEAPSSAERAEQPKAQRGKPRGKRADRGQLDLF